MIERPTRTPLTVLRCTLGLVILIEAILFLMPSARHDFALTHLPGLVRQLLGWDEIVGAVLLLVPKTVLSGAWLLIGVFVLAIIIHLFHGMFNVGNLAIYTAAAWTIASRK